MKLYQYEPSTPKTSFGCGHYEEVEAIPLDRIKKLREEISKEYVDDVNSWCDEQIGRNDMIDEVLELIDNMINEYEGE